MLRWHKLKRNSITPDAVREYGIGWCLAGVVARLKRTPLQHGGRWCKDFKGRHANRAGAFRFSMGLMRCMGMAMCGVRRFFPTTVVWGQRRCGVGRENQRDPPSKPPLLPPFAGTLPPPFPSLVTSAGGAPELYSQDPTSSPNSAPPICAACKANGSIRRLRSWVRSNISSRMVAPIGAVQAVMSGLPIGGWLKGTNGKSIKGIAVVMKRSTVFICPKRRSKRAHATSWSVTAVWQGVKLHANRLLLTDWLKGKWGFDGFLVTDWMSVKWLFGQLLSSGMVAINAGLDMVMVPFNYLRFFDVMARAEAYGDVALARIDNAVRQFARQV